MNNFVHLHCHSHYSLLDGLPSPMDLAKKAADLGMGAIAISDHGNLFGAIEFYKACKEVGVKPIVGLEAYTAPVSRLDKQHSRKKGEALPYNHITLLAKNNQGYKNLMQLSTLSYTEGFYYKPRIDLEILEKYKDGIICLTGCMSGEIAKHIINGDKHTAHICYKYLYMIFEDDLYSELMDTGIPEQRAINEWYMGEAAQCVATNDVHMINKEDIKAHKALIAIGYGQPMKKVEQYYHYHENYFKTYGEMLSLFPKEYLDTSGDIARKCNVEIELNQTFHIGSVEECYDKITDVCSEKAQGRPLQYLNRLAQELDAIKETGYSDYLWLVSDFIRYARDSGIPVGWGRGSSAGSLVCYYLGITRIDPIKYDLLFERFINLQRIEPPDIDVDVCQRRRGEIIDYLKDTYGADRVAQIATFGTLKTKAVIRDVCRVTGLPFLLGDQICKKIYEPWEGTVEDAFKIPEVIGVMDRFKITDRKELIDICKRLEGKPRHSSTHAAGIVISDRPLVEVMPLHKKANSEDILTQLDMHTVGELGLLKFDLLGLRTLTVIYDTCKSIGILPDTIPFNDPRTMLGIRQGNCVGVFQYEGWGFTRFIKEMRPQNFNHLVDLGALYRPGPLNSGMARDYVNRMHGVPYDCEHPILKDTYGIMLYQEQIMKVVYDVAGFTMNEADILRKAIGKKDQTLMDKMLAKIDDKDLADKIVTFARYGWNKAHAVSYALLSYYTAYLKFNYPSEFFCAMLNSEISSQDRMDTLIADAKKCGVKVEPAHVNLSAKYVTMVGGDIYMGILSIRGIGEKSADHLIKERKKGGFTSFENIRERIEPKSLNKLAMQALIDASALRPLPAGFNELHLNIAGRTIIDIMQIKAICGEFPGSSMVYVHLNGKIKETKMRVSKTHELLRKLGYVCTVIQ